MNVYQVPGHYDYARRVIVPCHFVAETNDGQKFVGQTPEEAVTKLHQHTQPPSPKAKKKYSKFQHIQNKAAGSM